MSTIVATDKDLESDLLTDEQHIAQALYMLTRAIGGRYNIPDAEMHGLLRDAAMHCEAARLHWTKEALAELDKVRHIFEDKST